MKLLSYDYSFMMTETIGEHGVSEEELTSLSPRIEEIGQKLLSDKPSFVTLAYDQKTLQIVQQIAHEVKAEFDNLIVLGIGGSDLGARATIAALNNPFFNFQENRPGMRVFFLGGNTDPQEIADVLSVVDLKKTAINIISKSGDTIEPMSAFVFLRDQLIKAVGQENHARHIIATTDQAKGTMRQITDTNGYRSLVVPGDVGGRFSVLSTVGLFPAACAGIAIDQLLEGAKEIDQGLGERSMEQGMNAVEIYAGLHFLAMTKHGQPIHILMPYAEHLRQMGFWYRQLWAESLGKKENLAGEVVNIGPTPVAALGSTDQHSQMQLYNEGPFDKVLTFIRVASFSQNYTIPEPLEDLEGVQYMKGHDFAKIINTEAEASAISLAMNGRPNGTITIPEISAKTIGALFMFYEWVTAYMGELLKINTYNQPGVESGKTAMYALLGREGFEDRKKELEKHLSAKKFIA